ncbi:MAG TPA: histidine phosphatase family protein [Candidatus Dormibacteraeota bacterium]|nr:histidine phosphatase family protein [Candidatus Dormibacteraeota bacterium]
MGLDLYLARHGATEWSENGRHTGSTDLPLLDEGEEQARRLGRYLQGRHFDAVYTSDLSRARRTAALAGFALAKPTPLLREFDYGDYEGLTTAEIRRRRPDWEIYHDGCPGGESPERVYRRARDFLRMVEEHTGAVIAFSHGHFLRALAAAWTDLAVTAASRLALDPATVSILRDGDHGRVVQEWNFTA